MSFLLILHSLLFVLNSIMGDFMKLNTYFYYINKRLFYKKKMFFFNLFIASLGLSLFDYVVMCHLVLNNYRHEAYRYARQDVEQCGAADFSASPLFSVDTKDEFVACLNEIAQTKEIQSIGSCAGISTLESLDDSGKGIWQQMIDISGKGPHLLVTDEYTIGLINYEKEIETLCMPPQLFSFCSYKWYQGEEVDVQNNQKNLLYLGYNYRDVPIGTILREPESGEEYEVAGILQKGNRMLDCESLISNAGSFQLSCSILMDNLILWIPSCDSRYCVNSSMKLFSCADGYSYEQGVEAIQRVAAKYNCTVPCSTYRDRIDTILSESDWELRGLEKLSILLIVMSCMILMVTQLLILGLKQRELGVWLLSGLSRTKIYGILLGENFIKLAMASVISFFVSFI